MKAIPWRQVPNVKREIPVTTKHVVFVSFLYVSILVGCNASPLWVKPGATEADLEAAMNECDQRYVASRFGLRDPQIRQDPMINPVRRLGKGLRVWPRIDALRNKGGNTGKKSFWLQAPVLLQLPFVTRSPLYFLQLLSYRCLLL